jgi:hypothetical protein
MLVAASGRTGQALPAPTGQPQAAEVHFSNVAEAAGLRFVHRSSPEAGKYFVESAPGGVAVFDYNGDGRPDIFFTNAAQTPSLEKTSAAYANRLYRNDGNMRVSRALDTRWGRPRPTTTTTATWIFSWPVPGRISSCTTVGTAVSKT